MYSCSVLNLVQLYSIKNQEGTLKQEYFSQSQTEPLKNTQSQTKAYLYCTGEDKYRKLQNNLLVNLSSHELVLPYRIRRKQLIAVQQTHTPMESPSRGLSSRTWVSWAVWPSIPSIWRRAAVRFQSSFSPLCCKFLVVLFIY